MSRELVEIGVTLARAPMVSRHSAGFSGVGVAPYVPRTIGRLGGTRGDEARRMLDLKSNKPRTEGGEQQCKT